MHCHVKIALILFFLFLGSPEFSRAEVLANAETDWRPSPAGAALRSLAFPGWGQYYVRRPIKAVIYSGIEQGFIYGVYREHKLLKYQQSIGDTVMVDNIRNNRNRLGWYLAASIILSVIDAYVDAHLYGFDVSDDLSSKRGKGGFLGSGIVLNLSWRTY